MSEPTPAVIALGSNLGDRAAWLQFGRDAVAQLEGVRLVQETAAEDTAPLGSLPQPTYLNAMVLVETVLPPDRLLAACHDIEHQAGRVRSEVWASRTLDLDLVRYGNLLCDGPALTLPHPGLRDREFWARQLAWLESHV